MIELTSSLRRSSDMRYRIIGGEGVVVRQVAGEVLVVSEVGARVLDLLEPGMAAGDILKRLAGEYDVDGPTLERDVLAFLEDLLEAGVIERVDG